MRKKEIKITKKGCRVESQENQVCEKGFSKSGGVLRRLVRRLSCGGGPVISCGSQLENSSITVSVSGGGGTGHGSSLSRRSSREPSPSSSILSSFDHHDNTNDITTTSCNATSAACGGQDWRRLVGSIKRKVRKKLPANNTNNNISSLQDGTKNHDDFLKATMRIFLVVSPPMARVQVRLFRLIMKQIF